MNCLTDVGGRKGIGKKFVKDININQSHISGSVYFAMSYYNMLGVRLEGSFGEISGADSVLKNVKASTYGRYERNLSFRSRITDLMLLGEFHPFLFFGDIDTDKPIIRLSPYLLAGIGYYSFSPEAKLGNNWIPLQPLRTEGQGFAEYPDREIYKLKQICFPVGIGARYELSQMFNLRAELLYRILNTDYLDDVSTNYIDPALFPTYLSAQNATRATLLYSRRNEIEAAFVQTNNMERGHADNNDAYFTFNLKLGIVLGRERIKKR
jgi:hypothetical protein